MRITLLSSTMLVALGLPGFAAAQSSEIGSEVTQTRSEVRNDEAQQDQNIDEVTVYATSNPTPVFEYPGHVSVISREDIETLSPSTISDALRDVPGVDFSGGPRRTGELPSIRGLSGQNVLILLDGARQSFTSAHDGRFFIDPELLGSAEVVRGPASSLYGSGAVGGVLAFDSVDAADLLKDGQTWGARLRGSYQSVNDETALSASAFTRQGAFDGLASFGIRQSGDIELGSGATLPSDDDIENALVKGRYALSEALSIEGSWQRFTNTAIEPNNGQGVTGASGDPLDYDVAKDITSDTFRAALDFNPSGNNWIDADFTAYRTISDIDEFDATIPRTTLREIETTGVSARNASNFTIGGMDTVLTLGGDWYRDEQVGTDDQAVGGIRSGVPNGESEFIGLFAQLEASLNTPLGEVLIIPGVRYDEFENSSDLAPNDENSDTAISPRIAASYGPAEWFRLFGSYSEGFRAPSINELYLDGVHFSVPHPILFNPAVGQFVFVSNNFIPNPNLKPERTETFEFGWGFDFRDTLVDNDHFQAKVSRYDSQIENLINLGVDFAYDPTCFAAPAFFPCTAGTSFSDNVANAEISGWEAELAYDSPRSFATLGYSTMQGEDISTGADIGALTPDRVSLNLGVKFPKWIAKLGSRIQYSGAFERRDVGTSGALEIVEQRGDYWVVDLYASWRPQFADNVRFDVGVDNVFDTDYERVFAGVSEPARNFKIAASYQFGG